MMIKKMTLSLIVLTSSLGINAQDIMILLNQTLPCNGEATVITSDVTGGTPDYTYVWSADGMIIPFETQPNLTINPLETTEYTLTVDDSNGDTNSATITVIVQPGLEAMIEGSLELSCDDPAPTTLTATVNGGSPPYDYLWVTGEITPSISISFPGDYCVSVNDANGCDVVDCVTVIMGDGLMVDITDPVELVCPDEEMTLTANVSGGEEPYIYSWSHPNLVFPDNVASVSVSANDLGGFPIEVTVFDSGSCQNTVTYVADNTPLVANATASLWDCNATSSTLDATSSTQGPNIAYEWLNADGQMQGTDIIIVVNQPGTYTLNVINYETGCTAQTTVEVLDLTDILSAQDITQILTACNTYQLSYITPINLPTLIINWTFPDGSDVDANFIIADETGLYTLNVNPGVGGCVYSTSMYIDINDSACATISGNLSWNEEGDCMLIGPDDTPLEGWVVEAVDDNQQSFYTLTNADGYYEINVPIVNGVGYTVLPTVPSQAWEACWDLFSVNEISEGENVTADFSFIRLVNCPELSVSLSTPLLRRCFDSYYWLTVCNDGSETAFAPELTLQLDDFLAFNEAEVTPTDVTGQEITWTFNQLEPGECRGFWVEVYVSCDAVLGQTHCSTLLATPDSLCVPGGEEWGGANLEVSAGCENNEVNFNVSNTGEGDLLQTVNYIVIEDGIMMLENSGSMEELLSAAEQLFAFSANGSTYTFEIEQAPGHPYTLSVATSIEGCGVNSVGLFSTGYVTQFATPTATPSSEMFCIENVGAYDPNDKFALPIGYGEEHYITPETELYYRIRFQNTGTDTAFTVVVRDELSEWLDLTSFRMGNASHNYDLSIDNERTLTLVFNNIMLPDSTTNLEGSQGFFDFKISPKVTIPLETMIENTAAIYFDFNDPVITNTVFHTVGREFIEILNWVNEPEVELSYEVYPNPTSSSVKLSIEGSWPENKRIVLSNLRGEIVKQMNYPGDQIEFDCSSLASAVYRIQVLTNDGGLLAEGKLVKQ